MEIKKKRKCFVFRTIDSIRESSTYELKFVFLADGWIPKDLPGNFIVKSYSDKVGQRVPLNDGVSMASGEYILRLDSHYSMSYGGDIEFIKHCKDNTICISVIRALTEDTWTFEYPSCGFVYINNNCEEKWWERYMGNKYLNCEPTMGLIGCG